LVNAIELRGRFAVLVLAALVLTTAAWLRSAEYDEQYTLFLTAGTPRPNWPSTVFPAGDVALVQAGHATLGGIARDLRATDVHPPLYFGTVSLWRLVFGPSLFAARMLSVLCGTISIALVGIIAHRGAIRPAVAMLLTLGCYGFVYTNAIARGFAMAEMLTLCGVLLLLGGRRVLAGCAWAQPVAATISRYLSGAPCSLLPKPGSRSWRRSRSLLSMPGFLLHSTPLGSANFRHSPPGRAGFDWRSIRSRRCLEDCRCMSMGTGNSL
jgi:hypothetical protein